MTITELIELHASSLPKEHYIKQSKTYIEIFDGWSNNILYANVDGRVYAKEYKIIAGQFKEILVSGFKRDNKTGNLTPFRRISHYDKNGFIRYEESSDGVKNDNNVYRRLINQKEETLAPKKPIEPENKGLELF